MGLQSSTSKQSVPVVLLLAYQSLGVVYGDLAVSPLYVFRSTFSGDLRNHVTEAEIYGVLSLIFWTLTLVPAIKYAIIVLSADDNGEGNKLQSHLLGRTDPINFYVWLHRLVERLFDQLVGMLISIVGATDR